MTVITTNLFHLPIWAQASQLVPISSGDRRRWGLGGTAALPTPWRNPRCRSRAAARPSADPARARRDTGVQRESRKLSSLDLLRFVEQRLCLTDRGNVDETSVERHRPLAFLCGLLHGLDDALRLFHLGL